MPKDLTYVLLLDYYGGLLPEKQRRLVEYYYCDDLSLAEISDSENITRQGARDSIVRGVKRLQELEDSVGFVKKHDNIKRLFKKYDIDKTEDNLLALKTAIEDM